MLLKRCFDFFFSLLGLIILSPLFLLISVLIVLDSGFPILFVQDRVGLHNKDFKVFKFRTMGKDSEKTGLLTIGRNDPRITRLGRLLRNHKLDELPQLLNILLGHMSFVGPRPEVRKYVLHYTDEDMKLFTLRPGMTSMASIHFRDEASMLKSAHDPESYYIETILPKKLQMNRQYMHDFSVLKDIKIILKTIRVVLFGYF